MLETFFFVKLRQHPAGLTTSIIIHPDPSSKIPSTHLLLRSLLEYRICNASTRFPTHHFCVSGCARTANVWSETNVAVTQHSSPRVPGHCVATCNIVLRCSSENFKKNAGLVWWRTPSTAYSLQCSNSSRESHGKGREEGVRSLHHRRHA